MIQYYNTMFTGSVIAVFLCPQREVKDLAFIYATVSTFKYHLLFSCIWSSFSPAQQIVVTFILFANVWKMYVNRVFLIWHILQKEL